MRTDAGRDHDSACGRSRPLVLKTTRQSDETGEELPPASSSSSSSSWKDHQLEAACGTTWYFCDVPNLPLQQGEPPQFKAATLP